MPGDWIRFGEHLTLGQIAVRTFVVVVISTLIGIDREMKNRPAGMRTHVLVALGALLIGLIEQETIAYVYRLNASCINVSVGRITSTVVSGVGFLGAGTIVMSNRKITGLTTAASVWCTACIGLAAGAGFTSVAAIVGFTVLIVLKLMQRIIHVTTYKKLEVQFVHRTDTLSFLNEYFQRMGCKVLDIDFHAETRESGNLYTNIYTLSIPNHTSYVDIIATLSEHPNVKAVRTRNL